MSIGSLIALLVTNMGPLLDSVMPVVEAGQMVFLEGGSDIAHGLSVELAPVTRQASCCSMHEGLMEARCSVAMSYIHRYS